MVAPPTPPTGDHAAMTLAQSIVTTPKAPNAATQDFLRAPLVLLVNGEATATPTAQRAAVVPVAKQMVTVKHVSLANLGPVATTTALKIAVASAIKLLGPVLLASTGLLASNAPAAQKVRKLEMDHAKTL